MVMVPIVCLADRAAVDPHPVGEILLEIGRRSGGRRITGKVAVYGNRCSRMRLIGELRPGGCRVHRKILLELITVDAAGFATASS